MKKILFFGLMLISVKGWSDTIVIDSQTSSGFQDNNPIVWNMTIGSGSNRAVVVTCAGDQTPNLLTGITVGSLSLTLANVTTDGADSVWTYYGIAPASGSQTITVSSNGGHQSCGAFSFTGVNQSTPLEISTGTVLPGDSGTTGYVSSTFTTTVAGDYLVDGIFYNSGSGTMVAGTSQTPSFVIRNTNEDTSSGHSAKGTVSAGTNFMSWTFALFHGKTVQAMLALEPAPAPGGTFICR